MKIMLKRKGFMASVVGFLLVAIVCIFVVFFFAIADFFVGININYDISTEQKFVAPFLMVHEASELEKDGKPFFQQLSYFGAGERMTSDYESTLEDRLSLFAYDYILRLKDRRLASYSAVPEANPRLSSSAIIPVFTFEKKNEYFTIQCNYYG